MSRLIRQEMAFFTFPASAAFPHALLTSGCAAIRQIFTDFQNHLLGKAQENGYAIKYAPDGRAYSVQINTLDVIGLQCVTTGRKFLNVLIGSCEYDREHQNIYLDCGSVVATDTSNETGLMSPDWKDGCKTELTVTKDAVEICMSSIASGTKFSRRYYRFHIAASET